MKRKIALEIVFLQSENTNTEKISTQTKQHQIEEMNPIFSFKNFRSFGEDGTSFEIAPITVLTGCNSAGKSSTIKAELLLCDITKQIKQRFLKVSKERKLFNISLRELFSGLTLHVSDKRLQLGRFDRTLNVKAEKPVISFSYNVFSEFLLKEITVELYFRSNDDNLVNDGILTRLRVVTDNTTLIDLCKLEEECHDSILNHKKNEQINYLCLMDSFKKALVFCIGNLTLTDKWEYDEGFGRHSNISSDEIENRLALVKKWIKKYGVSKQDVDVYRNSILEQIIISSFDATNDFFQKDSLYSWLPIFETTKGMTKQQVREWLLGYAKKICNEENRKPEDWVNYFCDDFDNSQYDNFIAYFAFLERKALESSDIDKPVGVSVSEIKGITTHKLIDWEKNIWEPAEIPNRLSRKEYDDLYSFSTTIRALEDIFFSDYPVDGFSLDYINIPYRYEIIRNLKAFARCVVIDGLMPDFLSDIKYINSASTIVRRLYVLDENDKIGTSINIFRNGDKQHFIGNGYSENVLRNDEKWKYTPGTFLDKWCQNFEIVDKGKKVILEGSEQGIGVMVYVEKDGQRRLMADEGYGISQLYTLLLQIECCILSTHRKEMLTGPWHARLASAYTVKYMPQYICVEEPEIHLHPKFQSLLADMFVEAYQEYNIRFIIETHSEYLIRKLQIMVADKNITLTPNDVSLNYVEKDEKGISKNRQIVILEDGKLTAAFGEGFYDEADNLAMELMKYKVRRK